MWSENKICNNALIIKLHLSRLSHNRRVASQEELKHRDAAHKGPVSTFPRGHVDHIHAVEQAVEVEDVSEDDSSSSPDKIQHEKNPAVNPIHDKPASRIYPSLPGEPYSVAFAEKTDYTKASKSELSYNPVKSQQVFHVKEAFQECDVTGNGNQDNGSKSPPNDADGPEELEPDIASNESPVSNLKVQPEDEKQDVAGQSSADTSNEEQESPPKTEHSVDYLKRSKAIELQVLT